MKNYYKYFNPAVVLGNQSQTMKEAWLKRGIAVLLAGQILVVALILGLPSSAQTSSNFNSGDTEFDNILIPYFESINLQDYDRAFSYWESAPNGETRTEFAAGFSHTQSVEAFFGIPMTVDDESGNNYAEIPTIITVTYTDGSLKYFAACYVAHLADSSNWLILNETTLETENIQMAEETLDNLCTANIKN